MRDFLYGQDNTMLIMPVPPCHGQGSSPAPEESKGANRGPEEGSPGLRKKTRASTVTC